MLHVAETGSEQPTVVALATSPSQKKYHEAQQWAEDPPLE